MEQPVQILLIEDSPLFVQLTRKMLDAAKSFQFDVDCVDNLADGIARLAKGGIDAVLLDLTLPDSSGLETFLTLHQAARDVPIVIYTSVDDESLSLTALNHGASDYLVKSEVNANWLGKSLVYAIQRNQPASPSVSSTSSDETTVLESVKIERFPSSDTDWIARVSERRLVTANVLEELKIKLLGLLRHTDCDEISVDMSQVEYLSNAAISMLLIVHKRTVAAGKQLVLRELKPQVYEQFSSRRFDRLFDLRSA